MLYSLFFFNYVDVKEFHSSKCRKVPIFFESPFVRSESLPLRQQQLLQMIEVKRYHQGPISTTRHHDGRKRIDRKLIIFFLQTLIRKEKKSRLVRLCFESKEIDEERTIDEGGSTQISQKNHRELLLTVSSFVRYILRTMPTQKMMMLMLLLPFLKAFHAKFFFPPEHSQNDDKHVQQGGNKYTTKKKRPRFCGPSQLLYTM